MAKAGRLLQEQGIMGGFPTQPAPSASAGSSGAGKSAPPAPSLPQSIAPVAPGGFTGDYPRRAARLPSRRHLRIAFIALTGIALHLVLRFTLRASPLLEEAPLFAVLVAGGIPLLIDLSKQLLARNFGSDLLAGGSIVTALILHQYLVGSVIILMLAGGAALEQYATGRASSALEALHKRMPRLAHRRQDGVVSDVALYDVRVGDEIVVFPHEVCPVDGLVAEGHGTMDEAYLTGEPFLIDKAPGTAALSGAVNGNTALTIRATKLAQDSRFASIVRIMERAELDRPRIRRIADRLGGSYTFAGFGLAAAAWALSGQSTRFLAVLVIATPCPLLLAIPVAIVAAISLAARRAIVIKKPAILEVVDTCRTLIFDKTGTLTRGRPELTSVWTANGFEKNAVVAAAASLERYSKHPLSFPILDAAHKAGVRLEEPAEVEERPGEGLCGLLSAGRVQITGRRRMGEEAASLPQEKGGMECVVLVNGRIAGHLRFHDEPRRESRSFIGHLGPRHGIRKVLLLSGDREQEVVFLASRVGISQALYGKSPEEKLAVVRKEAAAAPTLFVGDGINDAPAMQAATVGVAFGPESDITAEAAGAVVMEANLGRVDDLMHLGRRMRRICLQSAAGGMALSIIGMVAAAAGYLSPMAGAISQEIIDTLAILNALRMAVPPRELSDFPRAD